MSDQSKSNSLSTHTYTHTLLGKADGACEDEVGEKSHTRTWGGGRNLQDKLHGGERVQPAAPSTVRTTERCTPRRCAGRVLQRRDKEERGKPHNGLVFHFAEKAGVELHAVSHRPHTAKRPREIHQQKTKKNARCKGHRTSSRRPSGVRKSGPSMLLSISPVS
jgi:hypothetical protein